MITLCTPLHKTWPHEATPQLLKEDLLRQNCLEEVDRGKVQVINIVEMGERSVHAGNKSDSMSTDGVSVDVLVTGSMVVLVLAYHCSTRGENCPNYTK
ncbi:hypothetical protein NC653_028851 [Populus alba x Populus x berolinensis]|uniref:Uncharacterized protein n=1 Tax=Populus alba x Populus x berolinensis TaxID=444605 RepID=A0AAD6Q2P8_9ROSI|nr:hypothetical protein NC653_028851 [Populus alba x Populus x berolinensis]